MQGPVFGLLDKRAEAHVHKSADRGTEQEAV
jgi:hypothetical protein